MGVRYAGNTVGASRVAYLLAPSSPHQWPGLPTLLSGIHVYDAWEGLPATPMGLWVVDAVHAGDKLRLPIQVQVSSHQPLHGPPLQSLEVEAGVKRRAAPQSTLQPVKEDAHMPVVITGHRDDLPRPRLQPAPSGSCRVRPPPLPRRLLFAREGKVVKVGVEGAGKAPPTAIQRQSPPRRLQLEEQTLQTCG